MLRMIWRQSYQRLKSPGMNRQIGGKAVATERAATDIFC